MWRDTSKSHLKTTPQINTLENITELLTCKPVILALAALEC